jgi:hypothetical protein
MAKRDRFKLKDGRVFKTIGKGRIRNVGGKRSTEPTDTTPPEPGKMVGDRWEPGE